MELKEHGEELTTGLKASLLLEMGTVDGRRA